MTLPNGLQSILDTIKDMEAKDDQRDLDIYFQPGTKAGTVWTGVDALPSIQKALTPNTLMFELAKLSVKLQLGHGINLVVPMSEIADLTATLTRAMDNAMLVASDPVAKARQLKRNKRKKDRADRRAKSQE
jgi:hypothetical protein